MCRQDHRDLVEETFLAENLLVEGLGVGGGCSHVGVTGRLVGAGGELELCENI